MSFFIFILLAVWVAVRWIKRCLLLNQFRANSVWDIFYISSFCFILLCLIYFNFYSDFFSSLVLFNAISFVLLFVFFILDWEIDLYFDDLQEEI